MLSMRWRKLAHLSRTLPALQLQALHAVHSPFLPVRSRRLPRTICLPSPSTAPQRDCSTLTRVLPPLGFPYPVWNRSPLLLAVPLGRKRGPAVETGASSKKQLTAISSLALLAGAAGSRNARQQQEPVPSAGTALSPIPLVCPCAVTAGLLLDCLCVQGQFPACQLADEEGYLIPRRTRLQEGQHVRVVAALLPGESPVLTAPCKDVPALQVQIKKGMPPCIRKCLLHFQDGWAADDQIAFVLHKLQEQLPGVHVIDPLQAMHAIANRDIAWLPELPQAGCSPWQVVTAICVQGHWVCMHWNYLVGAIFAWSSDPSTLAPEIDMMHSLLAAATGSRLKQFRFQHAQVIRDEPGQCGWLALHALAERARLPAAEA